MPAHIRPSHIRFTCKTRPILNGYSYPGSESGADQGPPSAQSPFANNRCYLLLCSIYIFTTSERITPPSSLLQAHASNQIPLTVFGCPYFATVHILQPAD